MPDDRLERAVRDRMETVLPGAVHPVYVPIGAPLPAASFARIVAEPRSALGRSAERARITVGVLARDYFGPSGAVETAARLKAALIDNRAGVPRYAGVSEYDDDYSESRQAFARVFEIEFD